MQIEQQTKLKFIGVDIIHVNFSTLQPYDPSIKINIDIKPRIFLPKDALNNFNVLMDVTLKCDTYFDLSVTAMGSFEIEGELSEDIRTKFINVNTPAIMFPYVRAFISTLTSNLGTPTGTLIIPTQFFKGDLEIINENDLSKKEE